MGIFDTWTGNIGKQVSTLGSIFSVPNMGISGTIANQSPTSVVKPGFGLSPMPSFSAYAADNKGQIGQTGYPIQGTFSSTPSQPLGGTVGTGSTGGQVLRTGSTGGDGGGGGQPSAPSYEDQMRSSINSGYDEYTRQLNDMLTVGLPGQRQAQEGIAQTSFDQGVNALGTQRDQGIQQVNKQQASSLKDLSSNVSNLFNSGNTYLGARGAGDSSAANQYSYAIGKMGTKARGDILTQANDRMSQIGDIYNSETNRLKSEFDTKKFQIADWFNQAQNQIRSQIGSAGLNKEKDIQALTTNLYNQALSAMNQLQAETANRRASLESWAQNNSKTVGELVNNMKSIASSMPQFQGINTGMPQVTSEGQQFLPTGFGSTQEKKDLFGNRIQ